MEALLALLAKVTFFFSSSSPSEDWRSIIDFIEKSGETPEVWKLDIPRLPHLFTGTGDLFAALLLAWLHRSQGDLSLALNNSVSSLQGVLKRTAAHAEEQVRLGTQPYGVKVLELRLIQSKEEIETPPSTFKAVRLS